MHNKSECSAIILSAGFSSRMKQAKFSLMFDKQKTFLEKIVQEYLDFNCNEIIVVMNSEGIKLKEKLNLVFSDNVKFVLNKYPERERFYSLQLAVKSLNKTDCCFIQNIDNPFVTQSLLQIIFNNKNKADYIIPSYNTKGGHPILISKKVINTMQNEINYNIILKDFLQTFTKYYIKTDDDKILLNINNIEIFNSFFNENIQKH
jgi:molybdenum cofactor cytidylyltransferase